ncbi:MAG: hypothetical protein A3I12_07390 [Gammaproteobacteria bacterium RIFCSPLOWO2_02_FULL_38_11]|nr:MAG: hypothetical protein A3I12_07390 [Gammaproteobacteria bacterium RIFCSPLOWO2_02_FULL_38_11]OGT77738.1 MAG: hypothetical protein A3G71_07210 [Gammaproteobacteria bacterium RIFCSPLOWO2_12_FULL_38_14]
MITVIARKTHPLFQKEESASLCFSRQFRTELLFSNALDCFKNAWIFLFFFKITGRVFSQ